MSELLALEDVDVYYGPFHALRGNSLTVGEGEIVSLLGGNASGKSTTMKTILGLVRPKSGTVRFAGDDVTHASTRRRVAAGIASVPEARRVFPELTVDENLIAGAYTRRSRSRAAPPQSIRATVRPAASRRARRPRSSTEVANCTQACGLPSRLCRAWLPRRCGSRDRARRRALPARCGSLLP